MFKKLLVLPIATNVAFASNSEIFVESDSATPTADPVEGMAEASINTDKVVNEKHSE